MVAPVTVASEDPHSILEGTSISSSIAVLGNIGPMSGASEPLRRPFSASKKKKKKEKKKKKTQKTKKYRKNTHINLTVQIMV